MFTSSVPNVVAGFDDYPCLYDVGHTTPPRGTLGTCLCRSCINSRLAVYSIEPCSTIPLVYTSSESSPLGVLVCAVLFRQDLDIRKGVATGRSGRISLCDRRVL